MTKTKTLVGFWSGDREVKRWCTIWAKIPNPDTYLSKNANLL